MPPSLLSRLSIVRGRLDRIEEVSLTCGGNTNPEALSVSGNGVILPRLKWMTVTSGCDNDGPVDSTLIECFLDVFSHLHSLIMDDHLLLILKLTPQLITLGFEWNHLFTPLRPQFIVHSLFVEMSEIMRVGDGDSYAILPCLKKLELDMEEVNLTSVPFLDTNDFVDMISCDVKCGFYLPFQDEDGVEFLARLRDDGLDICLGIHDHEYDRQTYIGPDDD
ncbi:uncharacterized protein BT62DRAFT_1007216 [Guyanagaster necrorhizus]|uniref:Uncharacterized protein n=1 Tax=Guyanagaster necrorhizus TaxID=856835 RepID=A0A9P8ARU4_9AGAR|nr:uncharacterized protein BT62DRAFT_1007216 [Guyanagaster necrorhizus MCA 3950]KAG7445460.1 hypothetical protein BT62DRAFT_1007216 [Guyanagaster necrorhizus MCA 3950]